MKYLKVIFVLMILFSPIPSFASTNTYTRTRENLLVPSDVTVGENDYDNILKTPAVDGSEKVYDFANMFVGNQETLLLKQVEQYIQYSGIDLVIVTTSKLNELSIEKYASYFYDYNNFKDDGIIFVIYNGAGRPEIFMDRKGGVESKVFDIYTDSRSNQVLSIISEKLKKDHYYDAMDDGIKALYGFYNSYENGDYRIGGDGTFDKEIPWLEIAIITVSLTVCFIVLLLYKLNNRNRLKYVDNLGDKIDDSTFMIQKEVENFIGSKITKKK